MTSQSGLPGMTSAADHEADLRKREDDPTPRGVTRAVLEAAFGPDGPLAVGVVAFGQRLVPRLKPEVDRHRCGERPRPPVEPGPGQDEIRVLDVCAGYGCWASEIRRLATLQGWPVHITGIELDTRKREHLSKWCDRPLYGDAVACINTERAIGPRRASWDVAIGNPAFSLLVPKQRTDETVEDAADRSVLGNLLAAAPAVIQLHHTTAFVRGKVGRLLWRRHTPARQWLIPGAVSFRSDGKTDTRCYAASLWMRGHAGPTVVEMLPELGREELRWRALPGTEEPSGDLPAVPGWKVAA